MAFNDPARDCSNDGSNAPAIAYHFVIFICIPILWIMLCVGIARIPQEPTKKLGTIEKASEALPAQQARLRRAPGASELQTSEMRKLKAENRLLKAEVLLLQQQQIDAHFRTLSRAHKKKIIPQLKELFRRSQPPPPSYQEALR